MQVTLTLPPDLLQQIAAYITNDIRRELGSFANPSEATATKSTDLLTVEAVAKRLSIHQKTVIRYIRAGKLSASNHGSVARPKYRVSEADCAAFYAANRSR
jgi:excisionase family DNA binding protein